MDKKKIFTEVPFIDGKRFVLKQIEMKDKDNLEKLVMNENVYKYLPTFLFEKQYDDLGVVIEKLYNEYFDKKESIILGVYLKDNMILCGLCEIYGFKDHIHKVSIGYRLLQEYWGKGIASEVVKMLIDYLYTKTDIEIITASTMVENIASAKVLRKNGFDLVSKAVPEDWGYENPTIADKWIR